MAKGTALLIGLMIAALPGAASGQQSIRASFQVNAPVEQPALVAGAGAIPEARVPSGWAWSVSRDEEGRPASATHPAAVVASNAVRGAAPVARPGADVALDSSASSSRTLTFTFVPL